MKMLMSIFSKKQNAIDLLQQITKRAEDLTPPEQAKRFVSIRRIEGALKSRDSRIIFGRRGTGNTHILSFLSNAANQNGDIACSIDLRTLGSNNSIYSDSSIPASSRATTLIRDLITSIHLSLSDFYTRPGNKFKEKRFVSALDDLHDCVKTVLVTEKHELRGKISPTDASKMQTTGELEFSPVQAAGKITAGAEIHASDAREWEANVTGKPRLSVNMGDTFNQLDRIARMLPGRLWLMLDEWSSLPENLQPYLADFIRRAVLPTQNASVCIAAIEYRSRFREENEGSRIGLEIGSDISADINLDDYFVYDSDPDAAAQFFEQLLYKHLVAISKSGGLSETSAQQVISNVFAPIH